MNKNKDISKFFNAIKYIPFIIIGLIIIASIVYYDQITIDNIIRFTPKNKLLAIILLFILSLIKSVSIVLPTILIYGTSGKIFPLPLALIVNFISLVLILTTPYLVGSYYGRELLDLVYKKYPKSKKIKDFKNESPWFFVLATRLLKFIPGDILSMVLGAMDISYPVYLVFSLLVRIPPMVSNTFIGSSIASKSYKGAIISSLITLLISLVASIVFLKNKKG